MKGLVLAVLLAAAGGTMYPSEPEPLVVRGEKLFMAQGCYGCHTVGRVGTPIGPDLSRVGNKYPEGYLRRWLMDPEAQRPTAHMPKLELQQTEAQALAAWLATLK
jgi:cytochrome c oxidase subunit 2